MNFPCFHFITIASFLLITAANGQSPFEKGKLLYESGKYDEAKKIFESEKEKTSNYSDARYYLGRIAYDQKEYDDAVDYFDEAIEVNPEIGNYFNALGDTYAAIGENASIFKQMSVGPKALRAWEEAARLDSKIINARVSLVGSYLMAPAFMGGGEDKANSTAKELFPLLEAALSKNPEHHLHLYWYGKTSALTGLNLDRGEQCLKKYVTITPLQNEPSLAGANMRLGQINEKQGDKAEAKKYFQLALQQDASLKGAKEGLERISK